MAKAIDELRAAATMENIQNKVVVPLADALSIVGELEAQLEQRWQPIETAPHDGSCVLLTGNQDVWADEWILGEGIWMYCEQWSEPIKPTHWMPLPDPPKEQQ